MPDFDIKMIYQLIESTFGISQKDIEQVDLQDGKKDARLNGISLFHYFQNSRIKGLSGTDILKQASVFMSDNTLIELYTTSGNLLNSSDVKLGGSQSKSSDNIVARLIKEIHKMGFANLEEAISDINADNVVEVLEKYKKASDNKNSVFGKVFDHETLFEAILDESISDEKKKRYINHIKDALIKRISSLNGDTSFTGKLFSLALDTAIKKWWPFQNSDKLDKLCNEFINIIKQLETMQEAGEKVTPAKARKINRGFIESLKWMGISTDDLLGNGYFDNDSIQKTGNCWIHAGINAMLQIPESKQYLNNLVHKSPNGNLAVYLPGAKDEGLPKPKGDGVYVYTEKQISSATKEESAGDGEYTAICLAMRDYRREKTENKNATTVGGSFTEFCKLIYGKNAKTELFCDRRSNESKDDAKLAKQILDSCKVILSDDDIEKYSRMAALDSYDDMYKNLKDAYNSKKYIFKVSISGENYHRVLDDRPLVPDQNAGHAMAIVSMTDSYVKLKDSNDPCGKLLTISASDFVKVCSVEGFKIK